MGGHTENHTIKTERKGLGLNSHKKCYGLRGRVLKYFHHKPLQLQRLWWKIDISTRGKDRLLCLSTEF